MGAAELLPYASGLAAAAAGWRAAVAPSGALGRALRAAALGALAAAAFLRGAAPSALSAALLLSAVAQAIPPKAGRNWSSGSSLASFAAMAAFAYLFLRAGLGQAALADGGHMAAIAAAALAGVWLTTALLRRRTAQAISQASDAAALGAMLAAAFSLHFALWFAMAGACLVFAAEALALLQGADDQPGRAPPLAMAYWAASYLGQAAIVYAFLR